MNIYEAIGVSKETLLELMKNRMRLYWYPKDTDHQYHLYYERPHGEHRFLLNNEEEIKGALEVLLAKKQQFLSLNFSALEKGREYAQTAITT